MNTKEFNWGLVAGWGSALIVVVCLAIIYPDLHASVPLAWGAFAALMVALWPSKKK